MSNGSKLGLLCFLLLIGVRVWLNDRIPDDSTTIAMKRAGIFGYVMAGGCAFFGLILLWLIREGTWRDRQREKLRQLQAQLAEMDAEDAGRRRLLRQHDPNCPRRRRSPVE